MVYTTTNWLNIVKGCNSISSCQKLIIWAHKKWFQQQINSLPWYPSLCAVQILGGEHSCPSYLWDPRAAVGAEPWARSLGAVCRGCCSYSWWIPGSNGIEYHRTSMMSRVLGSCSFNNDMFTGSLVSVPTTMVLLFPKNSVLYKMMFPEGGANLFCGNGCASWSTYDGPSEQYRICCGMLPRNMPASRCGPTCCTCV